MKIRSLVILATLGVAALATAAAAQQPCAQAEARLARTGKGDRDHDGLSNCLERKVLGTSPRRADTDRDGMDDGLEVRNGTDPLNADTDADGTVDGADLDPRGELVDKLEGDLESLACPTADADGVLGLLGLEIALPDGVPFEGVADCTALADHLAAMGSAHVEVRVIGDATEGFVATHVELEDVDNDGVPDDVDLTGADDPGGDDSVDVPDDDPTDEDVGDDSPDDEDVEDDGSESGDDHGSEDGSDQSDDSDHGDSPDDSGSDHRSDDGSDHGSDHESDHESDGGEEDD